MADPNSAEFSKPAPTPDQPKPERSGINRRGVLRGLAGLTGIILAGGSAREVSAQTSVGPVEDAKPVSGHESQVAPKKDLQTKEKKEVPKDFSQPIERAVKTASNFLDKPQEIKLDISEGETAKVTVAYNISIDEAMDEETIIGGQMLIVTHSDKDKTPVRYTNLVVGENLGKLVSKSHGNYMIDGFTDSVWENFKLDLKALDPKSPPGEIAKLARLAHLFDFANYTDGVKRQDISENLKNVNETLFNKAFSIWMFESGELVNKLNNTPSTDKAAFANVFLKVLRETLECVSKEGVTFDSLGFNKSNIYEVVKMSRNPRFKEYFDEKIKLMGKPLPILDKLP